MGAQLPLFESERPDGVRLSISGTFTSEETPNLQAFKLGQLVQFVGAGYITKVTHARVGKGEVMERQHVLVLDGISFSEAPPGGAVTDAVQALCDAVPEGSTMTFSTSDGRSATIDKS